MKKLSAVLVLAATFALMGCSQVPAGNVGIKVYLLGSQKGVDHEELGTGRYWIGINEELYLFPMFEQNEQWTGNTEDDGHDESFTFQSKDGMAVNADFAITYNVTPGKAPLVFQRYRKGLPEIVDGPLRYYVRDALNEVASKMMVEEIYSEGKVKLIDTVQDMVAKEMEPKGITVTKLSLLGRIRLPDNVIKAIDSKVEATQRAQQRENELREAEAQAKKVVAEAEGEALKQKALAEGRAAATLTEATAQAKANRILSESLTPALIEYRKIDKWNGALPTYSGAGTPLINISK